MRRAEKKVCAQNSHMSAVKKGTGVPSVRPAVKGWTSPPYSKASTSSSYLSYQPRAPKTFLNLFMNLNAIYLGLHKPLRKKLGE